MRVNLNAIPHHSERMYNRCMVFPEVLTDIVQSMPEFTHNVHANLPRVSDFTTPAVLCDVFVSYPEVIAHNIGYDVNIGSSCRVINLRGCNDTINIVIVYRTIFKFLAYFSH